MNEKELKKQQMMFNCVIVLGAIVAVGVLYNGILCLETQSTVFDIEAHVIIPLGIVAMLLRYNEAFYKVHHRKLCLIIYAALVMVVVIGFAATVITKQNEDIIYSFGEMLAVIGLVCYDVATSKTLERL